MGLRTIACFMLSCILLGCSPSRESTLADMAAWRSMGKTATGGSFVKFVCQEDSLFLVYGNHAYTHAQHYGPCEIDLSDVLSLEFLTAEFAGVTHRLEHQQWFTEVFRLGKKEKERQEFPRPLAFYPRKNLIVYVAATDKDTYLLLHNYRSGRQQQIAMPSCRNAPDPLFCLEEVQVQDTEVWIWYLDSTQVDSFGVNIEI